MAPPQAPNNNAFTITLPNLTVLVDQALEWVTDNWVPVAIVVVAVYAVCTYLFRPRSRDGGVLHFLLELLLYPLMLLGDQLAKILVWLGQRQKHYKQEYYPATKSGSSGSSLPKQD